MNPIEYERMASVEDRHWWYRGLRQLVDLLIEKYMKEPPRSLLDMGCGTGENLRHFQHRYPLEYCGGFDASLPAVEWARKKNPLSDIYHGDICQPTFHRESYDLIVSMDVVNIPGIQQCGTGLQDAIARLRVGGTLILNLPALAWLYSEHDIAVHTSERYHIGQVENLLSELGLRTQFLSYRMSFLFPLIVAKRLPSILGRKPATSSAQSDVSLPARWLNDLLFKIVSIENRCLNKGIRFPIGSSIVAIATKD